MCVWPTERHHRTGIPPFACVQETWVSSKVVLLGRIALDRRRVDAVLYQAREGRARHDRLANDPRWTKTTLPSFPSPALMRWKLSGRYLPPVMSSSRVQINRTGYLPPTALAMEATSAM